MLAVVAVAALMSTVGSASVGASVRRRSAGTATATFVANPDAYVCNEPGFIGFENLPDGTNLSPTSIDGVHFTTTSGYSWIVGDFATGAYNGKYPAGAYTSEQTHWAWLGVYGSAGRIDFTNGGASSFSLLVSDYTPIYLDAYSSDGTLLEEAGPSTSNTSTGGMTELKVTEPTRSISYVLVHDTGNYFEVDSICTDAPAVPPAQLTLSSADGHPLSSTTVTGVGYEANEKVDVTLDGTFLGTQTANASGGFSRFIKIPKNAQPGGHAIVATGETSTISGTANYLVHTDWTQYGSDPARSSLDPYENTVGVGNVSSLTQQWTGATGARTTGPAITNGVVYTGSQDGAIYAFDKANGTATWSTATGGPIGSAPAINDGMVFTGSGDGYVYALNAGTGAVVWKYKTGKQINKSPLIKNKAVYIGSDDGYMYALNEATGKLLWRTNVGAKIRSTPATDGKNLYFGADDFKLHALKLTTGAPVWTVATKGLVRSNPSVGGGHVFVGSDDGHVYAITVSTGAVAWKRSFGQQVRSSPSLSGGLVYIGSNQGSLYALSAATGGVQWSLNTGGAVNEKPAIANGVVYVGSNAGDLIAANAATGAELLVAPVNSTSVSAPAVSDGAVYIGSGDQHEYKFGL